MPGQGPRLLSAGRRDKEIVFERKGAGKDGYGAKSGAWAEIGREWAAVRYGAGAERRAAAQEKAVQPATFYVLTNPLTESLTEADRIQFGGVWDITSNVPFGTDGREITGIRENRGASPA